MKINKDHISRRNPYHYDKDKDRDVYAQVKQRKEHELFYSKCPKCDSYGIYSLMAERVYNDNEIIPSDSENWMQCHRCGHLEAKVHAKAETTITGFIDISDFAPLQYNKTTIEPVHDDKPMPDHRNKRQQDFIDASRFD